LSVVNNRIRVHKRSEINAVQDQDMNSEASPSADDMDSEPKQKKPKYGNMFQLRKKIIGKGKKVTSELEQYLALPLEEDENANPLEFWERNEKVFPTLSLLAMQYLSMPASSGSVERLFSIAGAIARERRARIKTLLMEKTLSVREFYRHSL